MKRLGNVYTAIMSDENLDRALVRASRRKKRRSAVNRTHERWPERRKILRHLLSSGKYKTSTYREKILYEPKKRTIYSLPFFPDRIVHHAVMNILEPYWDARLIAESYANRKDKGMHLGSRKCMEFVRRFPFVVQFDVSKFYPSVDHEILRSILKQKIKDRKLLALLDEVIYSSNRIPGAVEGRNVPIGNLLSQWFGNVYLGVLDTWIKQDKGIDPFVRYCDDFLIFSDSKAHLNAVKDEVGDFLQERLALRLSKANLFRTEQGVDFLGYRHFPNHILLRKRNAKKIKQFVKRFRSGYYENDLKRARGIASSYHGLLKHAQTKNLRDSLGFDEILDALGVHPR